MVLTDSHCHLDAGEFDTDRELVWQQARQQGVALAVVPAVHRANFATVRELADRLPGLSYALGIHPCYVDAAADSDLSRLQQELNQHRDDPRLVAVGEIGLDGFITDSDPVRQERFLEQQIQMAKAAGLPIVLHVRRAQDRVLRLLRRYRPEGGIAHAFNGSLQQAGQFLDLGFVLGFGGAMTYSRALQIRRLVQQLPPHAHVLETDAPDIAPSWLSGQRNQPAELLRIAEQFAQLRGVELADACAQCQLNLERVLPKLTRLRQSWANPTDPSG